MSFILSVIGLAIEVPLVWGGAAHPPLERTPEAALNCVRSAVSYRPYEGFVKGPVAVLTDRTANAGDAAELLMFVLARQGIASRLAYGTLSDEQTTTLLTSAFKQATVPEKVQKAMPGARLADPVNDPALRKVASQHIWVQAKWQDKWIDLDPLFPNFKAGEAATKAVRTGMPPSPQERRQLRIEVFAKNKGEAQPRKLLTFQQPAAGLVGQRLVFFSQGPEPAEAAPAAAPGQLRPMLICGRYSPRSLQYGGEVRTGPAERIKDPFRNLDGDEPAPAAPALDEVWMDIRLVGGGRPERRQSRYLYVAGPGGINRLGELTSFCITFGAPPQRDAKAFAQFAAGLREKTKGLKVPMTGKLNAAQARAVREGFCESAEMTSALAQWLGVCSHAMRVQTDRAFGVLSDCDDARVLAVSMDSATHALATDLIFDSARCWARPGVKNASAGLAQLTRGALGGDVEAGVLATLHTRAGQPADSVLSVRSVFTAAAKADIPVIALSPARVQAVNKLPLSTLTRRIMLQRISDGKILLVPERPVPLAGRTFSAWYELDPRTGDCIAVWQDGRHQAMAEWFENTADVAVLTIDTITRGISSSATLYTYAGAALQIVSDDPEQTWTQIHYYAMVQAAAPRHWEPLMLAYTELMAVFGKREFDGWVCVDILNDMAKREVPADAAKAILDGQLAALAFLESGNPSRLVDAWKPKDPFEDWLSQMIDGLKGAATEQAKKENLPESVQTMQEWYEKLQKLEELAKNIIKASQ